MRSLRQRVTPEPTSWCATTPRRYNDGCNDARDVIILWYRGEIMCGVGARSTTHGRMAANLLGWPLAGEGRS